MYEKEIVRIRDVYVKFYETLELQDNIIQNMFKDKFSEKSFTTAEFCNVLGKLVKKNQNFQRKVSLQQRMNWMSQSMFQR